VEDDDRVVAAELEDRARIAGAARGTDLRAELARSGRADERHALVFEHRLADFAAFADDETHEAFAAVLLEDRLNDLLDSDRAKRRIRGGLPHHAVAAHRRDRRIPRPHRDGEVERADDP